MVLARKVHHCTKCKEVIPEGTNYVKWKGGKYHIDCAPAEALQYMKSNAHYPTSRRIMKKINHVGSVKGFFK